MDHLAEIKSKAEQLIEMGNTDEAVRVLFDLIVQCVDEKRFDEAEALRERLMEADEMALTEIIKSAELIEGARSASVDPQHREIFSDLYEQLTQEEANALYYAMREMAVDVDQTVYQQDENNDRLYFVDSGELKIIYREGEKEVMLKKIEAGDIVGEDTFFSIAVCTMSLIPMKHSRLRFLSLEAFRDLRKPFPGLGPKLKDYCQSREQVSDLLQRKGMNRRQHRRVKLEGRCSNQLLAASGKPMGKPLRGELLDLSCSGISFLVKLTEDSARLLLGRTMDVAFEPRESAAGGPETFRGTIVGANFHFFNEYSIHIKFDTVISDPTVNQLARGSESIS